MKSLQGTQTLQNLARAFAGESQARNRYTIYAEKAKSEGHYILYALFTFIAENERAHAKVFFDLLVKGNGNGGVDITAGYPFAQGNTIENLGYAAEGENHEWNEVYPAFADVARNEGFPEVEFAFRQIAQIEKNHFQEFSKFKAKLEAGNLYRGTNAQSKWKCTNCGYEHTGTDAPGICPVCQHPQGFFVEEAAAQ